MRPLPWARPRHELVLLALIALVALSPVHNAADPDASRLCLTRALEHGRVTIDSCIGDSVDRARFDGHTLSDKAPGMSTLAIPAAAAVRLPPPARWRPGGDLHVWAVRVLTSGVAFIALAFAFGRVSEGLAPGNGALALVAFALGTLVAPLAATTFGHVTAGALAFGALVLASRGRAGWAGLAAGAAVAVEYQTAVIGLVLAAYGALRGARALGRYALGAAPPLLLLAAYDWAAFGSPFHLSYQYVANRYAKEQAGGLLGIHLPRGHAVHEVLWGDRGLLVVSPVLVAGAAGLVLLARRYHAEAIVCAVVGAVFLVANFGYFLPYGGTSPGPRFLAPALPFVALGLAPAAARARRLVVALTAVSVVATTAVTLTWALAAGGYRDTIWGEIARLVTERGGAPLVGDLARNVLTWEAGGRTLVAAIVSLCAAAALLLAARRPA